MANSFKYVGKFGVMTDAPDLLYMRARYYMPSVGRFINKDPIGFRDGLNVYAYVHGNPISLIDPLGLGGAGGTWCKYEEGEIIALPIWEDPIFLTLTGFRFHSTPLHIGFDIPLTRINIVHFGQHAKWGKHIGFLFNRAGNALIHFYKNRIFIKW